MPVAVGEGVSVEYFVLPQVFCSAVCAGFDARAVATVLRDHRCQRQLKSDPLPSEVAEVNLTHRGTFTSASRSRRAKPGAIERRPHRHAAGTVLLAA